MPCMGAEHPTEAQVEEVTQAVLAFLKERYGVFHGQVVIQPLAGGEMATLLAAHYNELNANHREQVIAGLKKAIAEVLFQENCESF